MMNLIYVTSSVPGKNGTWVTIKDAFGVPVKDPPPFPTFTVTAETPRVMFKSPVDQSLEMTPQEFRDLIEKNINDEGTQETISLWTSSSTEIEDVSSDEVEHIESPNLGLEKNQKRQKEKMQRKRKKQLERQARRDSKFASSVEKYATTENPDWDKTRPEEDQDNEFDDDDDEDNDYDDNDDDDDVRK